MAECNLRGFLCGLEALTALRAPETLATTVRPACHMKFTDAMGARQATWLVLAPVLWFSRRRTSRSKCNPWYAEEISLLAPFAEFHEGPESSYRRREPVLAKVPEESAPVPLGVAVIPLPTT